MKRMHLLLVCLLVASVASAKSNLPTANTHAAIKSYVQHAAQFVAKHGPSCEAFKGADWMGGDYYIFVVGPDERTLCHPNPAIIGTPEKDIVDANGKKVGELISVAAHRTGGGWVEYVWPRPGQTTPVKKSTFATRVKGPDGKWYIVGSGAYEAK